MFLESIISPSLAEESKLLDGNIIWLMCVPIVLKLYSAKQIWLLSVNFAESNLNRANAKDVLTTSKTIRTEEVRLSGDFS